MEDFLRKLKKVSRVEFVLATISLVAVILDDDSAGADTYSKNIIPYPSAAIRQIAQAFSLYFSFITLNVFVVPKLIERKAIQISILVVLVIFTVLGLVWGSFDFGFIPLFVFLIYSTIKLGLIYLWWSSKDLYLKYRFLAPGVLLAFAIWIVSLAFFFIGEAEIEAIAIWTTLIPFGIMLYSYSFYRLIPQSLTHTKPWLSYIKRVIIILIISLLPLALITFFISNDDDATFSIPIVNVILQLAFTAPFSWFMYKRYIKGAEEVTLLQKELGKSTAKLDFLRSQINPHFLFNALNTLYGTAIQESADRTSEGIQKLGDMMRFMLQENIQDQISLEREVEYLNNYITLQQLRTDAIPTVKIETKIEQPTKQIQIAPMLLIPFVENAFKHGISYREPSYIIITLTYADDELFFDVSNSNHPMSTHDPERNYGGIGLENVKQRLMLLYPNKHELIIRKTEKDFFIHLTIKLT